MVDKVLKVEVRMTLKIEVVEGMRRMLRAVTWAGGWWWSWICWLSPPIICSIAVDQLNTN
jgi:hypothetical protein